VPTPIWLKANLVGAITVVAELDNTWVDWRIERYTDQPVVVQVRDAGDYPVNITGWAVRWTAGAYLTKSTAAGTIMLTTPLAGVFTFTITKADTLLLPAGELAEQIEHQCKGQEPGAGTPVHLIFRGRLRCTGTLITSV